MALKIFKSARAALEASRGTDTAPTKALEFDDGFHQQAVATIRPLTLRGSYFGYLSAAAGTETNTLELGGTISYDMAIWLGQTFIKGGVTGTGGAADKTWAYVPTAGSDDLKSASVQIGYSDGISATQPVVKLLYCLGDELNISWSKAGDGTIQYKAKMVSPLAAVQLSAFTGAAGALGATYVPSANTTAITIDTTTIGTTADNYWQDFSFSLTNGFKNLYTLNNTTAAIATVRPGARSWKLEGTRYYNLDTEWDAFVAKTVRKVRIKSLGPAVGGSNYKLELDLYGVYTAMEFVENDDMGFQKFTLEPVYDSTATTDFSLTIVSAMTAIT